MSRQCPHVLLQFSPNDPLSQAGERNENVIKNIHKVDFTLGTVYLASQQTR